MFLQVLQHGLDPAGNLVHQRKHQVQLCSEGGERRERSVLHTGHGCKIRTGYGATTQPCFQFCKVNYDCLHYESFIQRWFMSPSWKKTHIFKVFGPSGNLDAGPAEETLLPISNGTQTRNFYGICARRILIGLDYNTSMKHTS